MKNIKVSIITVAFNCANVIEQNITSCIGAENCEHIVIDNNSSDSTLEILEKYSAQIILVKNKENLGFTKANNQGIEVASGQFIFLLNPDAYIFNNTIANLLSVIENNSIIGAVAPVLIFPDKTIQNYTRRFPNPYALFVESFVPSKFWNKFNVYRKYTYQDIDFTKENIVEQPAGAAFLFYNKIKLDEKYFIYMSDVELCKNIIDQEKIIVQTPSAKVGHYQSKGGTQEGSPETRLYLDLDNYYGMQYFFKKHKQLKFLILYKILFFFGLFITGFIALIRFRGLLKMKRFFYFIKAYNFRNYARTV